MRTFITIILLAGGVACAQAQSRSLDYYVRQAIDHSPAIAEQRDNADVARLQKDMVHAQLDLPSVSASADYMYAPYSNDWGFDPAITDGGHYSALANISYPLFTSKNKRVRQKESSVTIQQSEYQIERIKHEIQQSVTDQYITVYQDQLTLKYLTHIDTLLSQQRKVLRDLAGQGIVNITDVKQMGIELQDNQIAIKKAKSTFHRDLMQLNAQCGIMDSTRAVDLQPPGLSVDGEPAKRSHFQQQFSLDSLQTTIQQQMSELKYQPDISLYGNAGLNAVKLTGIQNYFGYNVGVRLSVPLFDGNQKSISRQQSNLQKHSIAAYGERFRTERQVHLSSLQNRLRQTHEQLDLINNQIDQYQNLLDEYQKSLRQGLFSVVDYLTVLRNFVTVRQQRIQVLGEQWRIENELNYWNW